MTLLPLARAIADLDIGLCVIVKDGTVVAIEALEGTDEAIRRAGVLAGTGSVVVKVSRPKQDFRFDLPVVGLTGTGNPMIDETTVSEVLDSFRVSLGLLVNMNGMPRRGMNPVWLMAYRHATDRLEWLYDAEDLLMEEEVAFIHDAQAWMLGRVEDLEGSLYEAEFDYWKR